MVMISLARPAAPFKIGTLTGPSAILASKVQAVLRVSSATSTRAMQFVTKEPLDEDNNSQDVRRGLGQCAMLGREGGIHSAVASERCTAQLPVGEHVHLSVLGEHSTARLPM